MKTFGYMVVFNTDLPIVKGSGMILKAVFKTKKQANEYVAQAKLTTQNGAKALDVVRVNYGT